MQKKIEGFEILKQIGSGGFGEVYLANQPVINREVAIKVILPLHANQPDFIQRFQYEAELVARLEHPHIVPLYDYWRAPDGAYLVMRYISGGNLADMLVMNGPLDPIAASRLLDQIAGALHVAHRKKVIHQDIKPGNILLDEDNNAYLTDFGIARDIEGNVNLAEDDSNVMHGSPKYISPEHLRRREITHKSDIYSLGILMFEVLTGQPPFEHEDILQLLKKHVRDDLPPVQSIRADLPAALNQPLRQATVKDPAMRYESTLQFAEDFRLVVASLAADRSRPIPFPVTLDADDTGPIVIENPYKGLSAFQESDSEDFYGREALVESLIKSLASPGETGRFLAIVGPSGSGKSSVVRAGLLPAIRRDVIVGLPQQYISTMTPGAQPMRSLEGAILKVASRATVEMMERISGDSYDLNDVLKGALPDEDSEMLLLIDQFEELFTLVSEDRKRRQFLEIIHKALTAEDSRLRLLVTLRADFLDRPLEYQDWGRLFRERMELIPPMTQPELRSAIVEPARKNGLSLEDNLVDQILADISMQAGALPLLQYTLSELYLRRNGLEMTNEAYEEIGGVIGALARRADEIYRTLTEAQREAARLIFTRLVSIGNQQNHTRRRVLLGEIYALERDFDTLKSTTEVFGKYRLLTFDNDINTRLPTIEIAHEALISNWELLRDWLTTNADALRLQEHLAQEATQWHEQGQDSSFLATGSRLQQFATLLEHDFVVLTKREQDYLDASIELDEQNRARVRRTQTIFRGFVVAIFIFGIVAVIMAIIANNQRITAERARDAEAQALQQEAIAREQAETNARLSRARELAASSILFAETQPDTALLLALESLALEDTVEGQSALLSGLLRQPRLVGFYNGHDEPLRAVGTNADGTRVATGSRSGQVIVWDSIARQALTELTGHDDRINAVSFHPDRPLLVTADDSGIVIIHNVETGEMIHTIETGEPVLAARFVKNGAVLALGSDSGEITFHATDNWEELAAVSAHNDQPVYALAVSPDSNTLASGGDDNTITLWDMDDYTIETVIEAHDDGVLALAFSPDSRQLASGSIDQSVRVWDVASGQSQWAFRGHRDNVTDLIYSDDGEFVISGGADANIIIWSADSGTVETSFTTVPRSAIRGLADHTNQLYVASDNSSLAELTIGVVPRFGTQIYQDDENGDIISLATREDGTVAFSKNVDDDYSVYILQPEADEPLTLDYHNGLVTDLAWRGDRLVSVSVDGQVATWQNAELVASFSASDSILSLATSDNLIALGLNRGAIEVWSAQTSEEWERLHTLEGHSNRITSLHFNPDATLLASGSRDGSVIIWDTTEGTRYVEPIVAHEAGVEVVRFHPSGTFLASGGRDTNIRLWSTDSGEPLGPPLTNHENWVNDIAFSPQDSLMVSVSGDQSLILWDSARQRQIGQPFFGHSNWINEIEFSPEGGEVDTAGRDGQIFRWTMRQADWETIACEVVGRDLNAAEILEYFGDAYPPSATYCQQ